MATKRLAILVPTLACLLALCSCSGAYFSVYGGLNSPYDLENLGQYYEVSSLMPLGPVSEMPPEVLVFAFNDGAGHVITAIEYDFPVACDIEFETPVSPTILASGVQGQGRIGFAIAPWLAEGDTGFMRFRYTGAPAWASQRNIQFLSGTLAERTSSDLDQIYE